MPVRYFALREKSNDGSLSFICAARDIEEHRELVSATFRKSWAEKRYASDWSFTGFMSQYDEVHIVIVQNKN